MFLGGTLPGELSHPFRRPAQEVRERGARFVLAVGTYGPQVHPDLAERRRYYAETEVTDFLYPDRRLRALGKREGFEVIVLAKPLGQAAQATGDCVHGFENATPCGGHWNVLGHRLAGEHIAEAICQPPPDEAPRR